MAIALVMLGMTPRLARTPWSISAVRAGAVAGSTIGNADIGVSCR